MRAGEQQVGDALCHARIEGQLLRGVAVHLLPTLLVLLLQPPIVLADVDRLLWRCGRRLLVRGRLGGVCLVRLVHLFPQGGRGRELGGPIGVHWRGEFRQEFCHLLLRRLLGVSGAHRVRRG